MTHTRAETVPVTVAITATAFEQLICWLDDMAETAGVMLLRATQAQERDGQVTVVVRDVWPVDLAQYEQREPLGLSIRSSGWMPGLARAAARGDLFGFVHTHPGPLADPAPSRRDLQVDHVLHDAARTRLDDDRYLGLIVSGTREKPWISGRFHVSGQVLPVTRVRVAGDRLIIVNAHVEPVLIQHAQDKDQTDDAREGTAAKGLDLYDRQIRAFGRDGQAMIGSLQVGVVGAGGTGSAVAVQLARLGVRHLVLVDPDRFEATNVTRVHGGTLNDVGKLKVDVLADHLRSLGLDCHVIAVRGDVRDEKVMRSLIHSDVVFGCTDDHAGRSRLSRLPNRMLNLLIDIGVVIDAREGVVLNVIGRLTTVQPGGACLFCTRDVDPAQVAAQEMSTEQRRRLTEEGYAPGLGDPDPAVVAFTTTIAATAVTELLDRLVGWVEHDNGRSNRVLLYLGTHRAHSEQRRPQASTHWCVSPDTAGLADSLPLLGLDWRTPPGQEPS